MIGVSGMACTSCERRVQRALESLPGMTRCVVDYARGEASLRYDGALLDRPAIVAAVQRAGYGVSPQPRAPSAPATQRKDGFTPLMLAGIAVLMAAALLGPRATGIFSLLPTVERSMSYGMLLVIGLLTSLHCVAMCGGINLSQSLHRGAAAGGPPGSASPALVPTGSRVLPAVLYN